MATAPATLTDPFEVFASGADLQSANPLVTVHPLSRQVQRYALFVTLDPLVRQVRLPDRRELLLSDTVGFIDRLPHALVAAFRATLEEVAEADLALHVIDAANPERDRQVAAVRRVLEEVGAAEVALVDVYNKIDQLTADEQRRLQAAWQDTDARQYSEQLRTSYAFVDPRDPVPYWLVTTRQPRRRRGHRSAPSVGFGSVARVGSAVLRSGGRRGVRVRVGGRFRRTASRR